MEFMNIVRMEIKADKMDDWRKAMAGNFERAMAMGGVPGMVEIRHVQFGDNKICVVGRWESKEAFMAARPMLVANLDRFRQFLVPGPAGDTDPIAGSVVFSTSDAAQT